MSFIFGFICCYIGMGVVYLLVMTALFLLGEPTRKDITRPMGLLPTIVGAFVFAAIYGIIAVLFWPKILWEIRAGKKLTRSLGEKSQG